MPALPDDLFPRPRRPLDVLVRAKLERDAAGADVDRMMGRAFGRTLQPRRWLVGLPAAIAAALILGLFAIQPAGQVRASPAQVVAQAQEVHSTGDRCYTLLTDIA